MSFFDRLRGKQPESGSSHQPQGSADSEMQADNMSIEDLRALLARAKAQEATGEVARQGLAQLLSAPGDHKQRALALLQRGIGKYNSGDIRGAYRDFDQSVSVCTNADSFYNRGVAAMDFENYARAISDFTAAITFFPDYANAYHNRAMSIMAALMGQDTPVRPAEVQDIARFAKSDLEQAIRRGHPESRRYLGIIESNFGA